MDLVARRRQQSHQPDIFAKVSETAQREESGARVDGLADRDSLSRKNEFQRFQDQGIFDYIGYVAGSPCLPSRHRDWLCQKKAQAIYIRLHADVQLGDRDAQAPDD